MDLLVLELVREELGDAWDLTLRLVCKSWASAVLKLRGGAWPRTDLRACATSVEQLRWLLSVDMTGVCGCLAADDQLRVALQMRCVEWGDVATLLAWLGPGVHDAAMVHAGAHASVPTLRALLRTCARPGAWRAVLLDEAIRHGRVEVMQWFAADGALRVEKHLDALADAVEAGHVAQVHEMFGGEAAFHERVTENPALATALATGLVRGGAADAVARLVRRERVCVHVDVLEEAAARGDRALFELLLLHTPEVEYMTTEHAARGGNLSILATVRALLPDVRWGVAEWQAAAGEGHVHVFEWLAGAGVECACAAATTAAARGGHAEALRWLLDRGHECDRQTVALASHSVELLELLRERVAWHLFDASAYEEAARSGALDACRWLRAHGVAWDCEATCAAAAAGQARVLRWLVAEGCPCHPAAVAQASAAGWHGLARWLTHRWRKAAAEGASD